MTRISYTEAGNPVPFTEADRADAIALFADASRDRSQQWIEDNRADWIASATRAIAQARRQREYASTRRARERELVEMATYGRRDADDLLRKVA